MMWAVALGGHLSNHLFGYYYDLNSNPTTKICELGAYCYKDTIFITFLMPVIAFLLILMVKKSNHKKDI